MPRQNKTNKLARTPLISPTCSHKRRFSNKLAAERQAELQMLQHPLLELSTYQCPYCKGWHLTRNNRQ